MSFLSRYQNVLDQSNLSDMSKFQYKSRLSRLADITCHDIDWVLSHCKQTFAMMKAQDKMEPETAKALVNSIMAVFKYTKNLKDDMPKSYFSWQDLAKKLKELTQKKYDNAEPSQRQLDSYVKWAEIIEKRETMVKTSQEYLLLCMYTMIPPCRADLNKIRIYHSTPRTNEGNYIVLTNKKATLVFNEFKTRNPRNLKYEKDLPDELTQVIRANLKFKPSDYLIVSSKTGGPYEKANSYTVYFNTLLGKLFGKKVTINTLRHSYINSLDMNTLKPIEKDEIAKDMMHALKTMERYRYIHPSVKCDVVCKA
jgi:hypothetical protein